MEIPPPVTDETTIVSRRNFLKAGIFLGGTALIAHQLWKNRIVLENRARRIVISPNVTQPPSPEPPKAKPAPLPDEANYKEFIASLDLKFISPHEVIAAHRRERNGVANSLPPREFWTRIAPTLQVADQLRARLGVRLNYITSAYRSPAYNRQCPGAATHSQHTKNRALDLVYDCDTQIAMTEALAMRDAGLFKGGLGLYNNFIHIDTRGRNATW